MKKYILILFIYLSTITFSVEVKGFITYLSEDEIKKIEQQEEVNEYLEKKYPGKYYAEKLGDVIYVYPRIEYIKLVSNEYNMNSILKALPDIYIGKILRDVDFLVDSKTVELLKEQKIVNLYYRVVIDDNGSVGVAIDEVNENSDDVKLSVGFDNNESVATIEYIKGNFRENDVLNFMTNIYFRDISTDINIGYTIFDFKRNEKYIISGGLNKEDGLFIKAEAQKYALSNKIKSYEYFIKPDISLKYSYYDTHKLTASMGMNYKMKVISGLKVNLNTNIKYENRFLTNDYNIFFESKLNSSIDLSNDAKLNNELFLKFATIPLKDRNKIKVYDARIIKDKDIGGDLAFVFKTNLDSFKVFDSQLYFFNDLIVYKNFGVNAMFTNGMGVGIKSKFLPVDLNAYLGLGFNSNKKVGTLGGLNAGIKF
ncbi:hypothetical protein KX935_03255 [Streptobacillus moniliformis]|uniref:Uncharacterized protein n=1 Tax=Streptobacillus moniliformis (strain ATCC 14647 / DSM 12112 / NCTC 10651 / 9901) TaxID=519441 RepID=D1AV14_STRM9|nr:hypothetical protein [Streptobacillus moniliformis]ACZ01574.1 hypothetical protein Smon_1113 [Streptobacillus moniliformis DSM 12112]AVL43430.1 hypothetical protein CEP89_06280 [Streptobacillus moniliformis]QXW66246.1 hypothetical protein KX935_03255 [Streptobacillus moniliformis]SQA13258.1 Uncharacterised protein [Streptobacillus moniliformis]